MKYIASCSFGKDSTAMVLKLIEKQMPLDIVIFYNTGVEFDGCYKTRDQIIPILVANNIKYVELKPPRPFLYDMLEKEIHTKKGTIKYGFGWCGGGCRWATRNKIDTVEKYLRSLKEPYIQYIGIAYDEMERTQRKENLKHNKLFPLVTWQMTEKDCLNYCYKKGIDFNGVYKHLSRMSCWCCRNKNLKELQAYHDYLPDYFNKLMELEERIGEPMKKPYYLKERNWNNEKK